MTSRKTVKATRIAARAAALIGDDRQDTHGDMLKGFDRIATVWNGILAAAGKAPQRSLTAHDVANLMEGLKIARRYGGGFNLDDYVDGAGYAAVAGEIRQRQLDEVPW